jgi:hypothetical protein
MSPISPTVFLSYNRGDGALVQRIRRDLGECGADCWMDTERIRGGDDFKTEVLQREIPSRDLFVAYITPGYLTSRAWCMAELRRAITCARGLALLIDSEETLDATPKSIRTRYQCDVLDTNDADAYWRSITWLAGRAWASLQTVRRLVPAEDHIRAGSSILEEPGARQSDLLQLAKHELIIAGSNLRSWLSDEATRDGIVTRAKEKKVKITLILADYDAMRPLSREGEGHLVNSVEEIQEMLTRLEPDERPYLKVYFHPGASTLSAVFVDPRQDNGILFFTPRWAVQVVPGERLTCKIDKRINSSDLYKALHDSVLNMTQNDAKSIDKMLAERPAGAAIESTGANLRGN